MGSLYFLCLPCCFRASLFKKIGARLLPSIDCLKRISPLSFIPLVPYPARFARHLPLKGKRDRATVDRVLSYNGALETISLALSYRHCPIRLASLATFPTRGRLCPSLFFFSTYPVFALTMREKRHPRIAAFPIEEEGPRQRRSGALVNDALETIFPALFHTASPIQPPPLQGTSFHRKEGVSTRAPSLGRGCRAQRGGVGFLLGRHSGVLVNCRL